MWPFSKPAAPLGEAKSGTAIPDDWLLEVFGAGVAGSTQVSRSVAMTVPAVANAVAVGTGHRVRVLPFAEGLKLG